MKTKKESFEVCIPNLEGTEVERKVKINIPLEWDEDFNEWVLGEKAHQLIEEVKVREMGLLTPNQLKELRGRLKYTQKQMGDLFQIGEKSWIRWESGRHKPSRVVNLLIRMVYDRQVDVSYLWERAGKKAPSETVQTVMNDWAYIIGDGFSEITADVKLILKSTHVGIKRGIRSHNWFSAYQPEEVQYFGDRTLQSQIPRVTKNRERALAV